MKVHWHLSVDNVIIYGVSALIFFNVLKIGGAALSNTEHPTTQKAGAAILALVQ